MSICTLFIRSTFRSELSSKGHCLHTYCSVVEQTHNHLAISSSCQQKSWPLWTAYLDSLSEIFLLLCYIEDAAFDLSLMKSFEVSVTQKAAKAGDCLKQPRWSFLLGYLGLNSKVQKPFLRKITFPWSSQLDSFTKVFKQTLERRFTTWKSPKCPWQPSEPVRGWRKDNVSRKDNTVLPGITAPKDEATHEDAPALHYHMQPCPFIIFDLQACLCLRSEKSAWNNSTRKLIKPPRIFLIKKMN